MPRVSEEHLERRRQQILDAARVCFIRKGVHETSMQDIFAESGLSAGAVYRYFKSKNEIIGAITVTVIGGLQHFFDELASADPPLPLDEVAARFAERVVTMATATGPVRLAPQAWALALYDPELGQHVRATMSRLRDTWIAYARRLVEAGLLPAGTDAEAVGKTLFGLIPGFLLQLLLLEDITPADVRTGIRALLRHTMTVVPEGT
ncbi:TetR/AcrR family transcriptional regulator [Actinomadura hibisca]|uniref:TetR/AcrR family transcriptional regulator n=1 Tax=Actinomadura hibisca TaxID=68565 RepID=UPI000833C107|nr:TetR/AcrR family transcriptional regulator [Actinomadura hibisca]